VAAKKVKRKTVGKTTATGKTGFRLNESQKKKIIDAPDSMTLAQIAEQVGTSINTVAKYRSGSASATGAAEKSPSPAPTSPKRGRPVGTTTTKSPGSSGRGLSLEVIGDQITIRGSKSNPLLKNLVKEILA